MKSKFKQDRGTAGLTILLSLVVMLFVIGLIVMIFSLMSSELGDATYVSTTKTSANESLARATTSGVTLTVGNTQRHAECGQIVQAVNHTTGNVNIGIGNFSVIDCKVYNTTDLGVNFATNLRYTYSYTYDADTDATNVINATASSIAGVTDWFDIFVVIGAMVVLILLTVIIITAIRGSGMVGAGTQAGAGRVGTA